jgi:hypothetical protein
MSECVGEGCLHPDHIGVHKTPPVDPNGLIGTEKSVEEIKAAQEQRRQEAKKKIELYNTHKADFNKHKRKRNKNSHCPCANCREVRTWMNLPGGEFFQSTDGRKYTTNKDGMLLRVRD